MVLVIQYKLKKTFKETITITRTYKLFFIYLASIFYFVVLNFDLNNSIVLYRSALLIRKHNQLLELDDGYVELYDNVFLSVYGSNFKY